MQQMQRAIQQRSEALLRVLCQLPAAAVIDTHSMIQQIDSTLSLDEYTSTQMQRHLWKLPVTCKLSRQQVLGVMTATVQKGYKLPWELTDLPVAAQLTATEVEALLWTALERGSSYNMISSASWRVPVS